MRSRSQPRSARVEDAFEPVSVRRIRAVHRRLVKQQGPLRPKPRLPIIDELVMTLLSQNTSDVNSARAFAGLKERFPTWDAVRSARVVEIADSIRSGGLADQKAARMKRILAEIEEREGSLDLGRLDSLSDQEVTDYLCSFSGIGPKTAACVLVFSMGRAAFPVDTHVLRVALRLGWLPAGATAEQAHRTLAPHVPAALRYELHMALITHGRTVCTARRPACSECVLFDMCDAGPRLLASGDAV